MTFYQNAVHHLRWLNQLVVASRVCVVQLLPVRWSVRLRVRAQVVAYAITPLAALESIHRRLCTWTRIKIR